VDVICREREDTGNGSEYPSGFVRLLTRHSDALEEVILELKSKRRPVSNRVKRIAALAGVAGGAYVAARAMSVKEGLTSPREPFLWKPPRENSVLLRGVNLIEVVRGRTLKDRGLLFKDGVITGLVPTRDLEKGKLADLLVLSGNPLEDVRAVENVEAVFRSGVLLHQGPGFSPVDPSPPSPLPRS